MLQLVGCAALGIGIWLLVTDFGARKVTPIVGNQLYEVTTYLLIAGGGAVALLAFCGCCGTIREDKCVLSFVSGGGFVTMARPKSLRDEMSFFQKNLKNKNIES